MLLNRCHEIRNCIDEKLNLSHLRIDNNYINLFPYRNCSTFPISLYQRHQTSENSGTDGR